MIIRKSLVLVVLLIIAPHEVAASPEYRIASVEWIGWSPLQIAEAEGFWEKLGIDVEVVLYENPAVIVEAMKARTIDFAMDMIGSVVGLYQRGHQVEILAETNWSDGGDKILIQDGWSLDSLGNQPVGVFLELPSCLYFFGLYLQSIDMSIRSFRFIEMDPRNLTDQYIVGRLPVIVNYEPHVGRAYRRGGGSIAATSADYSGSIPEGIWAFADRLSGIPEDDIVDILLGWLLAVEWMQNEENSEAYSRIVNTVLFHDSGPYDAERIRQMRDLVRIHTPADSYSRNKQDGGLYEFLTNLRSFLAKAGLLERSYEPSTVFNNSYMIKALRIHDRGGR